MGYDTKFDGEFLLDRKVDEETRKILVGLNTTRRMKRDVSESYGVEGEFYFDGGGFFGQNHEDNIIDYNSPPITQPSLWCQWEIQDDGVTIKWDGGEKFYCYIEWLHYIIKNVLVPKGYVLSGSVAWFGESYDDRGIVHVEDNRIRVETS